MNKINGLQAFLRSKAKEASLRQDEPEIDWNARKQKWLNGLSGLYAVVKNWLAPLERDGALRYLMASAKLTEECIGDYEADMLTILIGKQRVSFYPKGTLIVGAEGRVDIRGPRGIKSLVFNEGQWQVIEKYPRPRFVPFNQVSFKHILSEIME